MVLSAEQLAERFGNVRKDNYLAHTIKEIERYILREEGKCYPILTYPSEVKHFKCDFQRCYCAIRVPSDCTNIAVSEIRIRLAHELGHIVKNMDKLGDWERLQKERTREEKNAEEIEAWKFAYYLIQKKSLDYQNNTYKDFIFEDRQLVATIQRLVKGMDPAISKELGRALPFVH